MSAVFRSKCNEIQKTSEKRKSSKNYNLFVMSAVFWSKWNEIQKTYKNHQNPMNSYWGFFGIFSEFVQFWLENSVPNQTDEVKWIILLLLTLKRILVEVSWFLHFFLKISDLWCHLAFFLLFSK